MTKTFQYVPGMNNLGHDWLAYFLDIVCDDSKQHHDDQRGVLPSSFKSRSYDKE